MSLQPVLLVGEVPEKLDFRRDANSYGVYAREMPSDASTTKKPSRLDEGRQIVSTADLARHLNLSQWTISRAINGHHDVSEETRRRVLQAMEDHDFRPNPFARGLRGRGSGMIGVCFSRFNIPILNQKVFELQEYLRERQMRSLLETTSNSAENERKALEDFRRLRVEGAVIFFSLLPGKEAKNALRNIPCVRIDPIASSGLPSVSLDRDKAMRLLLGQLLEFGHRRFALLGISPVDTWRWPPLESLAQAWGLNPAKIFTCYPSPLPVESPIEAGARMAAEALQLPDRPTALICQDDLIAVGAIQVVRSAGLSVPEDISVTGFNNHDVAHILRPTITTIEQNPRILIQKAGELLMREMKLPAEQRGQDLQEKVDPDLITGESTGPVRKMKR